jgi:very-short-patch-repair endonuclease
MKTRSSNATIANARALRRNMTDAEQKLWKHLRSRQVGSCKFRRQVPVGPYIVDFICLEKRLIIELDGGQHADQEKYDAERTHWLQSRGYRVLRFWNNDVMADVEVVKEEIYREVMSPLPLIPSLQGRGKIESE